MMFREAKLVVLALFHTFLLAICAANGNQTCRPSSCGEIQNISKPFRLKGDPSWCGDPHYELVCENNRTMVNVDLGKYYVADINYDNYTFRVVDPGVKKGNCFSTPLYSLSYYSFESYDILGVSNTTVLMNCEQPISDSNVTSSSSQAHVYALVGGELRVNDIKYSCTILRTTITQFLKPGNLSMSDLQEVLLLGLDFSFLRLRCENECDVKGLDCDADFTKNTVKCGDSWNWFSACLQYLRDWRALSIKGYSFGYWFSDYLESLADPRTFSIKGLREYDDQYYHESALYAGWLMRCIAMIIIIGRTALGILCLLVYLIYKFRRRHLSLDDGIEEFLHSHKNLQPIKYSYSELKKMTHNFKNKLGQGGFGSVYKGKLRSGRIVAVKMLVMSKANGQDFINEVATIGRIHHVNVVRLVGFCIQGSKWALVYDFMPNGSLDKFVFLDQGNNIPLSWERLYKIALGVACGIEYLHQGCDMQILHFDIKPHNILLDEDFTPKVSDFGLAKLYSIDDSIVSITAARGTLGYIAPELFYKNLGGVSFKADVYSFGMLLLEMVGKRKNVNAFAEHSSQIYFPSWIYNRYDQGEDMEMGDATEDEKKYVRKMVIVALWCIQMKPVDRPSMSKTLEMLEGEVELLKMPPKPTLWSIENHEQSMVEVPISSSNSMGTISLNGR
ncbi:rust resistance kinase Lr10-like isoform X2 [Vitis riparia]|uniref:rust resistance kinase Lr10-like isoform X2 n=1 Tax=Vitis riparia TaxID=96939 RepID=UPI00155B278C|nr:rust resistance kinase Lr10-like isoform X2 [Vitis riparia]